MGSGRPEIREGSSAGGKVHAARLDYISVQKAKKHDCNGRAEPNEPQYKENETLERKSLSSWQAYWAGWAALYCTAGYTKKN